MNVQAPLAPDRATLDQFLGAMFRHADPNTVIGFRAFNDDRKNERAIFTSAGRIGDHRLLDWTFNLAKRAAEHDLRANFCPPVCTFANEDKADEATIANGVVISVECDAAPEASRRKLAALLGEPTIVSASGGLWTDPETGEIEPKLHLHWRLTEPTRTAEDHALLKEARRLACHYVGADATAVPLNHPLRWPGSVHRKGAPKLARIVAMTENEVELSEALALLREACPDAPKASNRFNGYPGAGFGFGPETTGDLLDIVAALGVIPNDDLDWPRWNAVGLAVYAASDGQGFAAFDAWSRRSPKYDPAVTMARWEHFGRSPPTRTGMGALVNLAKAARPGWRKPSSLNRDSQADEQTGQDAPEDDQQTPGSEGEPKAKKASRAKSPPKHDPNDTRPTIQLLVGQLEDTVNQAERALIEANRAIYQRANMIVAVGSAPVVTADRKRILSPQIFELGEHRLMEELMASANFEKWDARADGFVPCNVSLTVVKTLEQRKGKFRLAPLAGIVNGPTMRDDGSLLTTPGYDDSTALLFDPGDATFPPIPPRPFREDAETALRSLEELISKFPFVDAADRSVALALILTACVRRSLRTAPLFACSAPVPGSGKSKLVDIANVIATGREAGVIAMGGNPDETEKRLASLLLSGSAIALDNVEAVISGDLLCQLLTQSTVRMRVLGKSESPELPTNVLVTATGNNIIIGGDMTRRALVCRLDPGMERPELRTFDFEPVAKAKQDRGRYLVAALTVLRAFHVAGRPRQTDRLGSFEEWSDLVRSALVWLGRADPVATIEHARAHDPKLESLRTVMIQWKAVIGPERASASEVAQRASEKTSTNFDTGRSNFVTPDFRDALLSVAGSGGFIDPAKLGNWLARHKGRVIDDMHFEIAVVSKGVARWNLVTNSKPEGGLHETHF